MPRPGLPHPIEPPFPDPDPDDLPINDPPIPGIPEPDSPIKDPPRPPDPRTEFNRWERGPLGQTFAAV